MTLTKTLKIRKASQLYVNNKHKTTIQNITSQNMNIHMTMRQTVLCNENVKHRLSESVTITTFVYRKNTKQPDFWPKKITTYH